MKEHFHLGKPRRITELSLLLMACYIYETSHSCLEIVSKHEVFLGVDLRACSCGDYHKFDKVELCFRKTFIAKNCWSLI